MVHTLERANTSVKNTYTPPNPWPLLPDLDPPQTQPSETEEPSQPSETEEPSQPSETEEPS